MGKDEKETYLIDEQVLWRCYIMQEVLCGLQKNGYVFVS